MAISDDQGLEIYSRDDALQFTWDTMSVDSVLWLPDGKGFLFQSGNDETGYSLYSWSFVDPAPNRIYECGLNESTCLQNLVWVNE